MAWRVMLHCRARSIGRRPSGPGYRNTPSSVVVMSKPLLLRAARMRVTTTSCGRRSSEPIMGETACCGRLLELLPLAFDMVVKILYIEVQGFYGGSLP